ncbi:serine/threonine-protein kinase [Streptomyces sp. NPDC059161]|uniref:serine/threonine-protein kinase n=1 Tax=Streptomyces sp. NPDC059161 TaxID=3346749 RepID=UPI0036769979
MGISGTLGPGDPERIGSYRLLARLGAGGMGQVYLARSDRGRTVAVKLVRPELADQDHFRGRFRQEVLAARRVADRWTAPVLDADTEAPVPWVATGYVAGPSLQSVVTGPHGPLPERSVRALARGLAHALKDIHDAGIVHRDLKPSNVLVTIDGPRVIDFGIARALETVTDGGLTHTGSLVGSPGFMAPEQVRGDPITPACDIFCLGSVLAYAASGSMPFGEPTSGVHALMFRIAQEPPDLDGVPEALQELIGDCLHKDPAARPSPERILRRVPDDADDPWLPAPLVAELGSHAVQLLDMEIPPASVPERPEPAPAPTPVPTQPSAPPLARPTTPTAHPPRGYDPYAPEAPEAPPQRSAKSTAALIAVAIVVAAVAGGSVYAYMSSGATGTKGDRGASPSATNSPSASGSSGSPDDMSPASPGKVPQSYVGSWSATIAGGNTRSLVIRPGGVGDTVLTLTADGSGYHCVFRARLTEAPASAGAPLQLGPSEVGPGSTGACNPGEPSTVTLLPDGRLHRQTVGTGEFLDYTKGH